jgi:hypothetical protein
MRENSLEVMGITSKLLFFDLKCKAQLKNNKSVGKFILQDAK